MRSQECTIVVVALNGGGNLVECLNALLAQGASCLVMLGDRTDSATWHGRFPSVRFVEGAASVPVRRMQGIEAAGTELVGLLEDSSVPGPQWLSALRAGFEADNVAAIGGTVTIGHHIAPRQQALGCCEFGRYHPALVRAMQSGDSGPRSFAVDRLPGNNIAYRRSSIQSVTGSHAALVETVLNAELRAAGFELVFDPAMTVDYRPRGAAGVHWIDRYRHGRLYGGQRAAGRPVADRGLSLGKALLLPFVLSGRSLRWMRHAIPIRAWWKVGPLVCWMETAWAIGEAAGTVAGVGRGIEGWKA
ncbi:MAG: glycosyltransferase [Betaproteobacteria bacterium]